MSDIIETDGKIPIDDTITIIGNILIDSILDDFVNPEVRAITESELKKAQEDLM